MSDTLFKVAATYKESGDCQYRDMLRSHLCRAARSLAVTERWRTYKDPGLIPGIADIILNEVIDPAKWEEDKIKADYLGMDKSRFYKTWRSRLNSVRHIFDCWAEEGGDGI